MKKWAVRALVICAFFCSTSFGQVGLQLSNIPSAGEIQTNRNASTADVTSAGAGITISGALIAVTPLTATQLILTFPAPITSAPGAVDGSFPGGTPGPVPTSDPITIVGQTGLFASVSAVATVNYAAGTIIINLPGSIGNFQSGSMRITGIKLDVVGKTAPLLASAALGSSSNNYILPDLPTSSVTLISSSGTGIGSLTQSAISGQTNNGKALILTNQTTGVYADATASFTLTEGFAQGWRTATQSSSNLTSLPNGSSIRLTISGLPSGVTANLVPVVPSGALAVTLSSSSLTAIAPTTTVDFTGTSLTTVESFQINVTLSGTPIGPLSPGSITVVATMAPIGTALANGVPTTAGGYPRFAQADTGPVAIGSIANETYLRVDRNSLSFTSATTGVNPASQTLNIGSSGPATAWTITTTSDNNFLGVTPVSGSGTGATLTVSANASSLPAGTFAGKITISSAALNNPIVVPVVFQIATSPTPYVVSTVAGNKIINEGGAATAQQLPTLYDVARDSGGNIYIVASNRQKVYKVTPGGILTTFAGNGTPGFSGDGGEASLASLSLPRAVAVDSADNVYIADTGNNRIRKVATNGVIKTIAGTGTSSSTGDGGLAIIATLGNPGGIALDLSNNIYFIDGVGARIRRIDVAGVITTVAGTGTANYSGDNGPATSAQINVNSDSRIAVDVAGNVMFSDTNNHRVRKVAANGVITTIAGTGTAGFSGDTLAATAANLNTPRGIGIDSGGNILFVDGGNSRVRRIATDNTISTVAGGGSSSTDGVAATSFVLTSPYGIAIDPAGGYYIADTFAWRTRKVAGDGTITTVAGKGGGLFGDNGAASLALIARPNAIAVDLDGNVYFSDSDNNRIRKIDTSGVITTIAGTTFGFSGDGGPATAAQLRNPQGVFVDAAGNLYIADTSNHRIRKITTDGIISTVAGNGTNAFAGDGGLATAASLGGPGDVVVDTSGKMYIADTSNHRVRKVTPDGLITTYAGTGVSGFGGDNGPATAAQLGNPRRLALDATGVIYIADSNNNRARRVALDGTITTQSTAGGSGVAVDAQGNVYASNTPTVTKFFTTGGSQSITLGFQGYSGDELYARAVATSVESLAVDADGTIYFTDVADNLVRKLAPSAQGSVAMTASVTSVSTTVTASSLSQSRSITINQDGAGLFTWSAQTSTTTGGNWLSITSAASGSGNGAITVVNNATGLAPGTYTGAVTFTSPETLNGTLVIPFTMLVPGPIITATPSSVSVRGIAGGLNPPAQPLVLTNSGIGTFNFTVTTSATSGGTWLSVSPTSGTSANGALVVSFNTAGLTAGTYSGTISITSAEGIPSPVTVPVTLTMSGATPLITVDRNSVVLTSAGPGINPLSQTVNIGNAGGGSLTWTAAASVITPPGGAWLNVSPNGGNGPGSLTLSGTVGSLAAGVYRGLVTITAAATNSPVTIPVMFQVGTSSGGPYTISTIAGPTVITEGGSAIAQPLGPITGVAVDSAGNMYLAIPDRHKIFKVTSGGILTTFAGTGVPSGGGDGGPAAMAQLARPTGVGVDPSGNVYIAETSGNRIRKVDTNGIITTIAGTGLGAFGGDGSLAILANLFNPQAVIADGAGNVYVSESNSHRVRKISSNGQINTIAGNGTATFAGDGGPATAASLNNPFGLALDSSGNLFIADANNNRVRKVATNGTISTVAGTGTAGSSGDPGPAILAQLSSPQGVAFDSAGNLLIADRNNNRIRKVSSGTLTTIAGTGTFGIGGDGGTATSAFLASPTAVAADSTGVYIADRNNFRVRKVFANNGTINTVAGNRSPGFAGDGGPGTAALLNITLGGAVRDRNGNVYFSDGENNRIRKIAPDGTISTFAGTGTAGFTDNIQASTAQLSFPQGLAIDGNGVIYFADQGNQRIRKIATNGVVSTIAGTGTNGFNGNGIAATSATLSNPVGVAVDAMGQVYFTESGQRVRKILLDGTITTIAGTGTAGFSGDGGPAIFAQVNNPRGIAVDASGNVFIADNTNNRTRKIDGSGTISTVNTAFGTTPGSPWVAVDALGNLYISNTGRIVRIAPDGFNQVIAGIGISGLSGDGGPAELASINASVIAVDDLGQLVFTDFSSAVVRQLSPMSPGSGVLNTTANFLSVRANNLSVSNINVFIEGFFGVATWNATTTVVSPSGGNWLTATSGGPNGGTLTVTSNAQGMSPGTYSGRIVLTSPQAINSITIPVSLTILPPTLLTTPSSVVAIGASGAPNPPSQSLLVGNVGVGTFDFTAARTIATPAGGSWFDISAASGHAGDGLIVSFNTTGLAAGTYTGTITLTAANTLNSPLGVPVTLTVTTSAPAITVSRNVLYFSSPTAGITPASQMVNVSNGGSGSLTWTTSATSSGWLSVSPGGGTGNGTIIVSAATGSLTDGVYTGTVNIQSAGATNTPVSIPVVYQVGGAHGPYTISTFAGPGEPVEGGLATNQPIAEPYDIKTDASGDLYIAVRSQNKVFKVTAAGTLVTVAGNGQPGWGGDGGPATAAQLLYPSGLAFDSTGNLYIADFGNQRVRRVTPQGIITTIAGSGEEASTGDGGPAIFSALAQPAALAVDSSGNIYVAENTGGRIRKIDTAGVITTFAGNGTSVYSGDGGPAISAGIVGPAVLMLDGPDTLYIVEFSGNRVRKVTNGIINTFAGNGTFGTAGDGGPATLAQLATPQGIVKDVDGTIYIAERGSHRIRAVNPDGTIESAAGTGVPGFSGDGGSVDDAQFNSPTALTRDVFGNFFVADRGNQRVRKIISDGSLITTVAGNGIRYEDGDNGSASAAHLDSPAAVLPDAAGNVFIIDASHTIRKVLPTGVITTSTASTLLASETPFIGNVQGAAIDAAGNIYIADPTARRIRKVSAVDGSVSIIAGTGTSPGFSGDGGPATLAQFNNPASVAVDASGNLYVADIGNNRIRKIFASNGMITTIAGTGSPLFSGDNGPALSAGIPGPLTIAVDAPGNVYLVAANRIRKIDLNGIITTVVGDGEPGFSGDGGPATAARITFVTALATDAAGNLYIGEGNVSGGVTGATRIRKVLPDGTIWTIAGVGFAGMNGDGGPAAVAGISLRTLAVDASGNIYFNNLAGSSIRKLTPTPAGTAVLSAAPLSLDLSVQSGSTIVQKTIAVASPETGSYLSAAYSWSATSSAVSGGNWLTLSGASGGSAGTITVQANPAGLAPGTYGGSVTITSNQTLNGSLVVPVTLRVFAASNPAPTLVSVTPSSVALFSGAITLTLTGTNFMPGSQVFADETGLETTFVSSTELRAFIPTGAVGSFLLLTEATWAITVANPEPGGGRSVEKYVTLGSPRPSITALSPTSGASGSSVNAVITGTNLLSVTSALFSGTGVTATLGSGTALHRAITINITPGAATTTRTVVAVAPGGASPSFSGFTVTNAMTSSPTLNALTAEPPGMSQNVAPLFGGPFTLTLNGSNFVDGAVVRLGNTDLTTTFVNAGQLTAVVGTSVLTSAGTSSVVVVNPGLPPSNGLDMKIVERGDPNLSRTVNIGDALFCALTVGGINKPALPLSVGDLNLSGSVSIGDCLVGALFAGRVNPNLSLPIVTSVAPSPAIRGSSLIINGSGFSAIPDNNRVIFATTGNGIVGVRPTTAGINSLTVNVPVDAVSGPIQVSRVDAALAGNLYGLYVSGTANVLALTSISPNIQVATGTNVFLSGMGFDPVPANNLVLFKSAAGQVAATVLSASSTNLTVTIPAGSICGPVTVGVGGQVSNARTVEVSGSSCGVQLNDIWRGAPGDVTVIDGTGFDVTKPANNIVQFGGIVAPVLAAGETQLHVHVPENARAGNVVVTVGADTSNTFAYSPSFPTVPSSVDVVVNSSDAVGAYQLTISFDKNLVTISSVNVSGGNGAGFTDLPTTVNIDNAAGTIILNHLQTGNSPSGQFSVANIRFTPVGVGTSNLTISGAVLTDTTGSDLPADRISLSSPTIQVVFVP